MFLKPACLAALWLGGALACAPSAAQPRIAVTDLAYETRVSDYFRVSASSSRSSVDASATVREGLYTHASRERFGARSESSHYEAEGTYTYIEYGELRKYTADLKGALLKGGGVRLVQGRPYRGKPNETLFDIVARIRQGQFAGADYVLFGTVSDIQFNRAATSYGGTTSNVLGLDMVVDFSLIDTRTHEVKAAFSAMGSGQDVKLASAHGGATFSRPKVIAETSRSLAASAYGELMAQLGLPAAASAAQLTGPGPAADMPRTPPMRNEAVISY